MSPRRKPTPEEQGQTALATAIAPSPKRGRVRRSDPETSRAAADDNRPRSGTQKARVLAALWRTERLYQQGMTAVEVSIAISRPLHRGTVAKRIGELSHSGHVHTDGETRATDTGSDALVWRLTDKGRSAVLWAGGPEALEREAT